MLLLDDDAGDSDDRMNEVRPRLGPTKSMRTASLDVGDGDEKVRMIVTIIHHESEHTSISSSSHHFGQPSLPLSPPVYCYAPNFFMWQFVMLINHLNVRKEGGQIDGIDRVL